MPQIGNSRGGQTRAKKLKRVAPSSRSDAAQRTGARAPKPKVVATPKPSPVKLAKQQERQYESQGRAVEKDANRKTRIRRRREAAQRGKTDAAQGGGGRQIREAQDYVAARYREKFGDKAESVRKLVTPDGKTTVPPDKALEVAQRRAMKNTQLGNAPVLKVLEQTTRPIHAIAAAAKHDVQQFKKHGIKGIVGHGSLKAAERGVTLKDKTLFSDVLKEAGVKNKTVAGGLGFALDVGLDPTTYVTGGTAAVARREATKAAERTATAAKRAGGTPARRPAASVTRKEAQRERLRSAGGGGGSAPSLAERAAARKERTGDQAKGVTIRVAGKEVPGVRKATAKAGKRTGKVIRRVTPERARTGGRNVLSDVNPNVAAAGVSKAAHEEAVRATRTARAQTSRGRDRAQKRALGVKRKLSEDDYSRVIDALEAGTVKSLPPELRAAAVRVRSDLRYANRLRKQAGIKGGERKNYVPHSLTEDALVAEGKKQRGSGSKSISPSYSKKRQETRPLAVLRAEQPGRYSEDLPSLVANRTAKGAEDAARAGLNRRLGSMGRPVTRGRAVDLKAGEAVFHIKGSDIREVADEAEIAKAARPLKAVVKNGQVVRVKGANTSGGRYVVLPKQVVDDATAGVAPKLAWTDKGVVRGLDKAQGLFKRVALATPGYHVRNLVGDSWNHLLATPGQRVPVSLARSGRVLKAAGRQDKANLNLDLVPVKPGKGKMRTGKYGELTYDQIAEQLGKHGAFRTGFTAKEIPELAASGGTGVNVKSRVPQSVKRFFLNREDLPRVATAVDALRKGATWEQAASYVAGHHFDYQHLTHFERNVARRAAPFWTFTSRNVPLQTRKLVTNPGKYAQYEKLRQEAAKATGMDEDARQARAMFAKLQDAGVDLPDGWEQYLSEWEQRNAGVPISWKGTKFTISFALPLGDLNELPGAAGKNQWQEYFQKAMSMATPVVKNPVEYFGNHSFFFRDQLQREYSPNVAAPAYVALFPDSLKKDIGVVKIRDKKSGNMVWGWPSKVDYIAKSVPGTPSFVQNLMTGGADRKGRKDTERILGFLGVKAVPVDAISNAVNLAYGRLAEIAEKKGSLNQQGVNVENITPEYRKLLDQEKLLKEIAYQGKNMRGDAVLPTQGAPPKVRLRKAPSSGGGFFGGGGSSSGSSSGGSSGGGGGFFD